MHDFAGRGNSFYLDQLTQANYTDGSVQDLSLPKTLLLIYLVFS